jgi:IS30 family transposase
MGSKKLQPEERDEIARLDAQGYGVREIARRLSRSPSTISAELTAGKWVDNNVHKTTYVAIHAQALRDKRAAKSHQPVTLKHKALEAYIRLKTRDGYSPEQISGRLKRDYPNDIKMRISHETIYAYIYAKARAQEKLWEYLPRKQKKRRKHKSQKVHKSHIPDRVSIHDRPEVIDNKTEFGHYEGDSVEGKRGVGDGIHTEVERFSRKFFAVKVARVTSAETAEAQIRIFANLPAEARRSTTLDNGRENHHHTKLKTELNIQAYFADPYSSWQRGSNENHNGLLRRYLPKKTDFTDLTQQDLDDIVEEINNRPRKCLGYKTANEVFSEEIKKLEGVRIRV